MGKNNISDEELRQIKELRKKRYTTVELYEPNNWGIWNDDHALSTYEVCDKLNEYSICNEELTEENKELKELLLHIVREIRAEPTRHHYDCNVSISKNQYEKLNELMNNVRW